MTSCHRLSLRVIVGVALFVGTVGHSRPASAQAILEWAKDHTAKWYAAFNAGDVPAIVQLYASDAVLLLQGETFNGRGAIEAFHTGVRFEVVIVGEAKLDRTVRQHEGG